MSKRHQAKAPGGGVGRTKAGPAIVAEPVSDLAGLARLPGGSVGSAGNGSMTAQVAWLGDGWLQTAQRQALVAQIRKLQGNRHLQRLLAPLKGSDTVGPFQSRAHNTSSGRSDRIQTRSATVRCQEDAGYLIAETTHRQRIESDGLVSSGIIQLSPLSDELEQVWINQGKRALFIRLRNLGVSDPDVHSFVERELSGDDLWLALNLLNYGPEANWPIHLRVEREMKGFGDSGGKVKVFSILRAANGAQASNADLTATLSRVFAADSHDLWVAQSLQAYGPEVKWPVPLQEERKKREKAKEERMAKLTPLLARLTRLSDVAGRQEAAGAQFRKALDAFKETLQARMETAGTDQPLSPDLQLIMKALMLWSKDPGNQWGEGVWDSKDLVMSAPDYATVPASQYKCNAYVAESIYQALKIVHQAHESAQEKGKYFPYRASEWGDPKKTIPHFVVVGQPKMGDIWSTGTHVGIYLGTYIGKGLYISARDDGDGVFGLQEAQEEHGVQIKYVKSGGVYRRYSR